jgi:hypothetical protein
MDEAMDEFFEKMSPALDNIYKFEIKDGIAIPPKPQLPDFVVERLNYFVPFQKDGLTFMGVLEMVLAEDEERAKKDFFGGGTGWLPVTDEFKKWRDDYPFCLYHQMEIAVAIMYGFVGQEESED